MIATLSINMKINSKSEFLNPKQIQMSNIKTFNPACLNSLNFEYLNLFVILCLGFGIYL
jgi:hypothetical protein